MDTKYKVHSYKKDSSPPLASPLCTAQCSANPLKIALYCYWLRYTSRINTAVGVLGPHPGRVLPQSLSHQINLPEPARFVNQPVPGM